MPLAPKPAPAPVRAPDESLAAFRTRLQAWVQSLRNKEPDPMSNRLLDDIARLEAQATEHEGAMKRLADQIDEAMRLTDALSQRVAALPPGPRVYTLRIEDREVAVPESEALVFACVFITALMGREPVRAVLGGEKVELQAGDAYAIARQILQQAGG